MKTATLSHPVIRRLESDGYTVQRCGFGWEIYLGPRFVVVDDLDSVNLNSPLEDVA